jgi:hypothetical protein
VKTEYQSAPSESVRATPAVLRGGAVIKTSFQQSQLRK